MLGIHARLNLHDERNELIVNFEKEMRRRNRISKLTFPHMMYIMNNPIHKSNDYY